MADIKLRVIDISNGKFEIKDTTRPYGFVDLNAKKSIVVLKQIKSRPGRQLYFSLISHSFGALSSKLYSRLKMN